MDVQANRLVYRLRSTGADRLLTKLGLRSKVSDIYDSLEYRLQRGIVKHQFGNASIQYQTESKREYQSLRHLAFTEEPVIQDFLKELHADDVVFDLGAHLGLYSILAAAKLTDGSVVAFDMLPANTKRLREVTPSSVEVVEKAVAENEGPRTANFETGDPGTVRARLTESGDGETPVDVISLDRYVVASGTEPTVLKIDVEGAEKDVLAGGAEALSSAACRTVYIEIHDKANFSAVVETLESYGFTSITRLHERGGQIMVKAKNR